MLCLPVYTVIMQLLRVKLSWDSGIRDWSVVCWRVEDIRTEWGDEAAVWRWLQPGDGAESGSTYWARTWTGKLVSESLFHHPVGVGGWGGWPPVFQSWEHSFWGAALAWYSSNYCFVSLDDIVFLFSTVCLVLPWPIGMSIASDISRCSNTAAADVIFSLHRSSYRSSC